MSDAFDWIYDQTGGGIDAVGKWAGDRLNEAKDVALRAWDGMDEDVARLGLEAYSHVGTNIDAVKNRLPRLLLNQFKTWINYQEHGYSHKHTLAAFKAVIQGKNVT